MGVSNKLLGMAAKRGSTMASAAKVGRIEKKLKKAENRGNTNRVSKYQGKLGEYRGLLTTQLNRNFEKDVNAAINEYKWRPLGDPNATARVNRLLRNANNQGIISSNLINKLQNKYEAAKSNKISKRNTARNNTARGANYAVAAGGLFGLM